MPRCRGRPSTGLLTPLYRRRGTTDCLWSISPFTTFGEPARPCSMSLASTGIGLRNASPMKRGAPRVASTTKPNTRFNVATCCRSGPTSSMPGLPERRDRQLSFRRIWRSTWPTQAYRGRRSRRRRAAIYLRYMLSSAVSSDIEFNRLLGSTGAW